jgi:putative membrane protein
VQAIHVAAPIRREFLHGSLMRRVHLPLVFRACFLLIPTRDMQTGVWRPSQCLRFALANLNPRFQTPQHNLPRREKAMHTFHNRSGKKEMLIAALAVSAFLTGCSSRQSPPATPEVAAAPETAPTTGEQAAVKNGTATIKEPPVLSAKQNTAIVLSQIHQANLTEIAIGNMAQEKASTSEVRSFANQLVQDDTNADQMVVAMAHNAGVRLHDGATSHRKGRPENSREKQEEQKLASANGADFDRLFLKMTSADHARLINMLQQAREDASDDQLEALIDKIVPILQQHKELAQILMKKEQA